MGRSLALLFFFFLYFAGTGRGGNLALDSSISYRYNTLLGEKRKRKQLEYPKIEKKRNKEKQILIYIKYYETYLFCFGPRLDVCVG